VAAREGHFLTQLGQSDLEALLLAGARAAAAAHDVTIERTELALSCDGARTVLFQLRVTASTKILLAKLRATIRGSGRLAIDDALNAHLSQLHCEGEGMTGTLAVGLIRRELEQWEGRTFPLTAFSPTGLALRDLRLGCRDGLQVEARFGG
jgi:hypothetical protein